MCMTVASVLSHLVVRPRLFCKINENENKRKINIDLAVVASQIPGGAIHDSRLIRDEQQMRMFLCSPHLLLE